jgi:RNase H-fold protein (predicted Holliday junction resolvase)
MTVTLNLEYSQIINIVRQLPAYQIEKLKKELSENFVQTKSMSSKYDFQNFILSGPVMSDEQYQEVKQQRENFNLWRTM